MGRQIEVFIDLNDIGDEDLRDELQSRGYEVGFLENHEDLHYLIETLKDYDYNILTKEEYNDIFYDLYRHAISDSPEDFRSWLSELLNKKIGKWL